MSKGILRAEVHENPLSAIKVEKIVMIADEIKSGGQVHSLRLGSTKTFRLLSSDIKSFDH